SRIASRLPQASIYAPIRSGRGSRCKPGFADFECVRLAEQTQAQEQDRRQNSKRWDSHRQRCLRRKERRQKSWKVVDLLGFGEELLEFLMCALPAHDPVRFRRFARTRLHGDLHQLVFLKWEWLGGLEHAVFVDGFGGNRHEPGLTEFEWS